MTERLTAETFENAIGTAFTVSDPDGNSVELTLVTVATRDQVVPNGPAGWVPFTLTFEGPREPFVPQGTFAVEHAATGRIDVFLVPSERTERATRYEAVFG